MGKCRKRKFRDEIAAKLAIATIGRKDNTNRAKTEVRAYFHPCCRAWHITSAEVYEGAIA